MPTRLPRPEIMAKQDRARALSADGCSWSQVAEIIGYANKSSAYDAALASARRDPIRDRLERVDIEDARLEWLLDETVKIYKRRHFIVAGKDAEVVRHPDTGEALDDDGVKLEALKVIKALSESRRKLRGLDAPTRKLIEAPDPDSIAGRIAELEAELGTVQS